MLLRSMLFIPGDSEKKLAKADEIAWTPNSVARGAWEVDATPFIPK